MTLGQTSVISPPTISTLFSLNGQIVQSCFRSSNFQGYKMPLRIVFSKPQHRSRLKILLPNFKDTGCPSFRLCYCPVVAFTAGLSALKMPTIVESAKKSLRLGCLGGFQVGSAPKSPPHHQNARYGEIRHGGGPSTKTSPNTYKKPNRRPSTFAFLHDGFVGGVSSKDEAVSKSCLHQFLGVFSRGLPNNRSGTFFGGGGGLELSFINGPQCIGILTILHDSRKIQEPPIC